MDSWLQVRGSHPADGIRYILAEVGDEFLRHINHVAGPDYCVFIDVFAAKNVLHIDSFHLEPIVGSSMKEKNLGFRRCHCHSAGYCERFGNRDVGTQLVLAGLPDLARNNKKRLLKVLEVYIDDGVMKGAGVGLFNRKNQFGGGQSLRVNAACVLQVKVTVWLNFDRLIEFWREGKRQRQDVFSLNYVPRVSVLKRWVSRLRSLSTR